jgi:hypothetical protein
VMAKKAVEEKALRDAVMADPKMKDLYGGAWDEIANAMKYQRENYPRYALTEAALPGRFASMARTIVRVAEEKTKPNEKRLRGFQDQALPTLEQQLYSTAPISRELELTQVTAGFEQLQQELGKDDALVRAVLGDKSPADRAAEIINATKLDDIAVRKELYSGGKASVDASNDPMIVLMRTVDPAVRDIRKKYEDNVDAVVRKNGTLIAKARFAKYGTAVPPDATSTLRLSYGQVKSYKESGKNIHYHTTIGEAFQYADKNGNKAPYKLPESWMKAKAKLDLNTSLDSVNTTDIIGGNSGSPAVNKKGEIVGIIFDGNIQSLPWNVMYDDKTGRSVITDSTAVVETLRKVYNANPLVEEILASSKSATKKAAPAAPKSGASMKTAPIQKNAALPATK